MAKVLTGRKGFTLVEVIVVAVIVAVLALVSIQLYQGYVRESRANNAENIAASASSFIQSALNSEATLNPALGNGSIYGPAGWTATMPNSGAVTNFTVPRGYMVTVTSPNVTAEYTDDNATRSENYPYITTP